MFPWKFFFFSQLKWPFCVFNELDAAMSTSGDPLDDLGIERKPSVFETLLADHFSTNDQFKHQKSPLLLLNDSHLHQFNSLLSNLPFETIKRSYDAFCSSQKLLQINTKKFDQTKICCKQKHPSSRTKRSFKSKKSDSVDTEFSSPAKSKPAKRSNSAQSPLSADSPASNFYSHLSNQIVIHVCDEAKRLKQDFACPRELLVTEMKYFSYNLNDSLTKSSGSGAHAHSSISQAALSKKSLDEIDISVHCDINIFDWLMRYVKRNHPHLNEKNIASKDTLDTHQNMVVYAPDSTLKYAEPRLEISNCVSILLSSDFLLMGDLIDKCVVFIAKHLEAVLQVPCVMSGISEPLLVKLAACSYSQRLIDLYDRKDKLKTKLYQRKLEFMFNLAKYKSCFRDSTILNEWKHNRFTYGSPQALSATEDNYLNYLYEIENDASGLFKCKLCSRLMTKRQSFNLKCELAVLNKRGQYVYLHVPDDKLDLTKLVQLLRDKLKSWQNVYWFVWSLVKVFKCKRCNEWFRLVEMNGCRLNDNTLCDVHDTKSGSVCACIHSDHVLDAQTALAAHAKSLIVTEASPFESPELRFSKYIQYLLEMFEKVRHVVLSGVDSDEGKNCVEVVENILKMESQSKELSAGVNKNAKLMSPGPDHRFVNCCLIDSITGRQIALVEKNVLNLIKISNQDLASNDLRSYLALVKRIDPVNIFNCLDVFGWLMVEPKMRWDVNKPTRFNQDNQREDDLKRFREISIYLIRNRLHEENSKANGQRSPIALLLSNSVNSNSLINNFVGGIYCRVESQWKQKN
ncbi:hypothetical protein BpHYR1_003757 [Brachionus plicatilis]|uniref:SANT and BTB domain-containing protein n=1 Tax=Brachionus plicatilis TaxID=10195 RepID=A0A3M7SPJ5_BRAPC|nr:hypothetical protein BpHYR1_003757 [Brachionus plicatilis]